MTLRPPSLAAALVGLKRDDVVERVRSGAARGDDPLEILAECQRGMAAVGERFQAGDYYLSELLLAAEIFKAAAAVLDPYLAGVGARAPLGTVVLATMRGDIHDLGKNIFATLLRARGFGVHDLGVDVAPSRLVAAVQDVKPEFVGLSALLTTTFAAMKEAVGLLEEAGLRRRVDVLVGGGVTTPAVKEHVGADFQTADATAGVAYCLRASRERLARPPGR